MSATTFRVGDIRPNPFRDLATYPVVQEAVEELREAYRTSGYLTNVVARLVDGVPELAYGHTRHAAFMAEYGPDAMMPLVIENLSDTEMWQAMVQDNNVGGRPRPIAMQEAARAVVLAWAGGRLPSPVVPPKTSLNQVRYAPSFRQGGSAETVSTHGIPYTAEDIAALGGLGTSRGVRTALAALEQQELGVLTPAQMSPLGTRATLDVTRAVNAAERTARAVQMPEEQVRNVMRTVGATVAHEAASNPQRSKDLREVARQAINAAVPMAEFPRRQPPAHRVVQNIHDYFASVFTRAYEGRGSYADLLEVVIENAGAEAFQPDGPRGVHLDAEVAARLRELAAAATDYADRIENARSAE